MGFLEHMLCQQLPNNARISVVRENPRYPMPNALISFFAPHCQPRVVRPLFTSALFSRSKRLPEIDPTRRTDGGSLNGEARGMPANRALESQP
jgi:hypothetical protein